jgi:hypothetical protein
VNEEPQKLEYHTPQKHESIAVLVGLQILDLFALFFVAVVIVLVVTALAIYLVGGLSIE